jgi:hemerythrin-like metal-binding protein
MPDEPAAILKWTGEIALHVEPLDTEHQDWFESVNRLHRAMLEGKGIKVLGRLLVEMVEYGQVHFAHEEELMASTRYPGRAAHIKHHDEFRRQTKAFLERFEGGQSTMTIEMTVFLSEWIRQHTMTVDMAMGEHLRANEKRLAPV